MSINALRFILDSTMTPLASNTVRNMWRRLSGFDIVALVIFALGVVAIVADLGGGIANFIKFLAVLCLFYLLFRMIGWWRSRLLWSLRNRLIVAYLFIALVPILLIVTLVALAGRILYSQLGAYLLYEDIQTRINTSLIWQSTLPRRTGQRQEEAARKS